MVVVVSYNFILVRNKSPVKKKITRNTYISKLSMEKNGIEL